MDRETLIRTVIAGAIILGIMVAWPYADRLLFPRPEPPQKAPAVAGKAGEKPAAEKPAAEKPPAEKPAAEKPAGEKPSAEKPAGEKPATPAMTGSRLQAVGAEAAEAAKPVVFGSTASDGPYDYQVSVSPRGAAVSEIALARKRFFKTVGDRHLPPDERAPMILVDPAGAYPAFAIPELRIRLKDSDTWVKVDLSKVVWQTEPPPAEPLPPGASQVAFSVAVADDAGKTVLKVRKTFLLDAAGEGCAAYQMRMKVAIESLDDRIEKVAYVVGGPPALPVEGSGSSLSGTVVGSSAVAGLWGKGTVEVVHAVGTDLKKTENAAPDAEVMKSLAAADLIWAGQTGKYFAIIMIPQKPSVEGTFAAGAEAFQYKVKQDGKDVPHAGVRIVSKEFAPAKGQPVEHEFTIFAGPKESDILETCYGPLGLSKLIVWATPCCFVPIPGLEYISKFLVWVLDSFYALAHNYGVAIILMVVLLRVALHPVTRWSSKSMAEMAKMQPRMEQIRKEFAHDKERMQQEMTKIGGFKQMGGCLPMFIQMPIWVALYGALGAAIQLRQAPFLPPSWVPDGSVFLQDLAAPDMLLHWTTPYNLPGVDLPLLGYVINGFQGMLGGPLTSFNILPILVAAVMYLQQKVMPQAKSSNPQMEQQKKMMSFMMVFFGLVLYNVPSGLCVYIFTSTFLGAIEQWFIRKQMAKHEVASAARAEEAKSAPPSDVRQKSRVSGREKSLAERIHAWMLKQMTPPEQRRDEEDKGGKRRKK